MNNIRYESCWRRQVENDIHYNDIYNRHPVRDKVDSMQIEKVIFNDPATIVYWKDGTKTVVKVQEGDFYDPEIGMVMAIAKKALGNKGNYYNVIKTWVNAYYEANANISINRSEYPLLSCLSAENLADKIRKAFWNERSE